ncbi:DUF3604 domain-containing protein [Pseudoteredinibacter isoporae]|uniref:DUF3604 domain-containing protein n=1 Tax=Pseudoteredinibacter isoporae TaxID=570281 RepID=A0A7X0MV58_9GAMM|nr:DUF3604 domain-containing protein [Pseudoteredinibacter isoporae]MBB6521028.1 hypothetical protein [Pseudoteredinibacter isoporae]NHO86592.1 DUF3604 domain-containing protein [Pseudoteredinibacter isoporae]NIB24956.1 DUF3604 domain-containing protein [Pseudoteredinibacter isoporae]
MKRLLTLLVAVGACSYATAESTQLYWGDTHLHTSNSFDVYLFGTPASTLDTAYRFAKGLPVISPTTGMRWQLSEPLDFLVIADHAEMMGTIPRMLDGEPLLASTKSGKVLGKIGGKKSAKELLDVYSLIVQAGSGIKNSAGLSGKDIYQDLHGGEKRRSTWDDHIQTADRYNAPGVFTTFIGWEWSATPKGGNLHRVVFTPEDATVASQFLPYSTLESSDPKDLWKWLDKTSKKTGADFLAIPHNPNVSLGQMFPLVTQKGDAIDEAYAGARMRWEKVIETTQIKGDSEAHPLLSPTDEFADFETFSFLLSPDGRVAEPDEGDYVRSGLKRGLELRRKIGVNPYQAGMIGSTDSHTGLSAVEENNFSGKGQKDSDPVSREKPTGIGSSRGWDMGAAGYVAVWAEENSRDAIFAAFKRKEVYATTGPRIQLRFFGGFDFEQADVNADDPATVGYQKGVPMGGDLTQAPKGKAPTFLVQAIKDPREANLDRIQIVKAWVDSHGKSHEKIYDVALSDGRQDGAQAVGNTVDLKTGKYSNSIGDEKLTALWRDPDFDARHAALYYARVLQIPTPRYSLFDAIALGIDPKATGRPATIQERVYGSPIWYSP